MAWLVVTCSPDGSSLSISCLSFPGTDSARPVLVLHYLQPQLGVRHFPSLKDQQDSLTTLQQACQQLDHSSQNQRQPLASQAKAALLSYIWLSSLRPACCLARHCKALAVLDTGERDAACRLSASLRHVVQVPVTLRLRPAAAYAQQTKRPCSASTGPALGWQTTSQASCWVALLC